MVAKKKIEMPDFNKIPRGLPMGKALPDPEVKELGILAHHVLGYEVLYSKFRTPIHLGTVLNELGIEVLDTEAVETYKTKRLAALNSGQEKFSRKVDDDDPEEEDEDEGDSSPRRYRWALQDISSYSKPIPEAALAKAIQIKQNAPDATFYIHAIERDVDPFIEVRNGDERYIFDVWGEPKFTGVVTKTDAERANLRTDVK